MSLPLLATLDRRRLIAQVSDRAGLDAHFSGGSQAVYAGFDPTAPSLQVGNLVPLLMLRRFQLAGHRPVAVLGGATGAIGDPSDRTEERSLNDAATIESWLEGIGRQVARFIDTQGERGGLILNNLDWTRDVDVIAFLRDVGKHFSVNAMIGRDFVRSRLDREGAGISYTEFSYVLLQAHDFLHLARRHDCRVQIGGADQWGNLVSGIDLVRRVLRKPAYALSMPLMAKSDGTKFGKSASGSVWLDPSRTSPYAFYQFWVNAADSEVVNYLRVFTLLGADEIDAAATAVEERAQQRDAQRLLAREVTRLVHGDDALASAQRITEALFNGDVRALGHDDLMQLEQDGMDATRLVPGTGLLAALTAAGLAKSNAAARRLVEANGVRLNGEAVTDSGLTLDTSRALFGRYHVVRRGRKNWHLIVLET
ncbi:MAG: tyrosine--tRNA ligase [Gammaproteobacteria bacterium]|nr:tyrosine--tRNA ligase [Gammaproteobacteria bacterium]